MSGKQTRAKYTQEYKLEAVRQVRAGQSIAVTAKVLGIPKGSLGLGCVRVKRENWRQGRLASR